MTADLIVISTEVFDDSPRLYARDGVFDFDPLGRQGAVFFFLLLGQMGALGFFRLFL